MTRIPTIYPKGVLDSSLFLRRSGLTTTEDIRTYFERLVELGDITKAEAEERIPMVTKFISTGSKEDIVPADTRERESYRQPIGPLNPSWLNFD